MSRICNAFNRFRHRGKGFALVVRIVFVAALAACASADEIELVGGKRYQGRVIEQTPAAVTFKIVFPGGGSLKAEFRRSKIKSLKITGKEPVVKPAATRPKPRPQPPEKAPPKATPSKPPKPPGNTLTPAKIKALIQKAGKTPPQWWDSVSLDYPQTLDLAGTNPLKGWHPRRNLGAYFISVVNPNPGRWKPWVKLLHTVLKVRKNDPTRLRQTTGMLGTSYQRLLKDSPRAAFWFQRALGGPGRVSLGHVVGLAECYFKLGSKPMAVALLKKYGVDRLGYHSTVKLFADMGEHRRALQLAEAMARRSPVDGYLAAGNVCRLAGRHKEALAYYSKALSAGNERRHKRSMQRARSAIEAIRLYETLDIGSIADGTYNGRGAGFRGPMDVAVEVKDGKIVSVKVKRHREDMAFTAPTDIPEQIVEKQDVRRIDAVTGATVSSEAIVNAAAKALARGMK